MTRLLFPAFALGALAAVLLVRPALAAAAPPSNDDIANATAVVALPFSDVADTTQATTEATEPLPCGIGRTVWYRFTASDTGAVEADPAGSTAFDITLAAYHADGGGGPDLLACRGFGPLTFQVQAGETYYVQAGTFFLSSGGFLHLALQFAPPPPNDDFAAAAPAASLPFGDTVDLAAATMEPGEPAPSCAFVSPAGSAWYAFTPSASQSVTAAATHPNTTFVAVYTGGPVASLTPVACGVIRATLRVTAGTTYYLQVAGDTSVVGSATPIQFSLGVAPDPVASFSFFPSDPSRVDAVQFSDGSFDPANAGLSSEVWNFGDSATAGSGCCPIHPYTADGDYTVRLTVTTVDGRTASTSQTVHVRTHDVAITKLLVPQAARRGQTRSIVVGVANHRYPERVEVEVLKSVAGGGFTTVGTLTGSAPVRDGNRTTDFSVTYTFTSDDAALGKVTFQAVVRTLDARDALPADNTATALPTVVTG